MHRFDIRLTALANMSVLEHVDAETEEEAEKLALQKALDGDVIWHYDGLQSDSTIEIGY